MERFPDKNHVLQPSHPYTHLIKILLGEEPSATGVNRALRHRCHVQGCPSCCPTDCIPAQLQTQQPQHEKVPILICHHCSSCSPSLLHPPRKHTHTQVTRFSLSTKLLSIALGNSSRTLDLGCAVSQPNLPVWTLYFRNAPRHLPPPLNWNGHRPRPLGSCRQVSCAPVHWFSKGENRHEDLLWHQES